MGDRALMQCHDGTEFGPVLYLHWAGHMAFDFARVLHERMSDGNRMNDLDYWSARLVQIAIGGEKGATGFGVSNAPRLLLEGDSHGDAGVVLIDVRDGSVRCFGGYLKAEDYKPAKVIL